MIPCPRCGTTLVERTSNAAPGRPPTEWEVECRTCQRAGFLSCRDAEPGMEDFARRYARAAFERWEASEKPPSRNWRLLLRRTVAGIGIAVGCLVVGAWQSGLHWNHSASMPTGLWRVTAFSGAPERGEVVTFCADTTTAKLGLARGYLRSGQCPGGAEELLKPVVAVAGDVVTVSRSGVAVDGRPILGTVPLAHDGIWRPLHTYAGTYRVQPGQVWVVSSHDPRSFDSRYFGPISLANIRGVASPVMVTPSGQTVPSEDEAAQSGPKEAEARQTVPREEAR